MTYYALLQMGRERLRKAKIPDAETDARWLLLKAADMTLASYYLHQSEEVSRQVEDAYRDLLQKREHRIPLQHLLGCASFMGLDFKVSADVLIPRADTENMVEEMIPHCDGKRVLDLCTGSGCIGISVCHLGKPAFVTGSDISLLALTIARENADAILLPNEAPFRLVRSDLFSALPGIYDVILTNPPYIPTAQLPTLAPEVREHDPHLALDGGENGLSFYRRILSQVCDHLSPGGIFCTEIGDGQVDPVEFLMRKTKLQEIALGRDLSGRPRFLWGRKPGNDF